MDYAQEILKVQKNRRSDAIFTCYPRTDSTAEDYYQFICHQPEQWNVASILEKEESELTKEEKRILSIIQKENKIRSSFENFLSSQTTTSQAALDVYNFMASISINQYAKLKFTQVELDVCHDLAILLSEKGLEEAIESLNQMQRTVYQTYMLVLLRQLYLDKQEINTLSEEKRKRK